MNRNLSAFICLSAVMFAAFIFAHVVFGAEESKDEVQEAVRRMQQRIEQIRKEDPNNSFAVAAQYKVLFERFPRTIEGKMAAFEVYEIHRKAKRQQLALGTLALILTVYKDYETLINPLASDKPIGICATAQIEMASMYSEDLGTPLIALETLSRIPYRYPNQQVGILAGDRQYQGRAEVIALWHTSRVQTAMGEPSNAIMTLRELCSTYPKEEVMVAEGKVLKVTELALHEVHRSLSASMGGLPRQLSDLSEFESLIRTPEDKVYMLFIKGELTLDAFVKFKTSGLAEEACGYYLQVIDKFPALEIERGNIKRRPAVEAMERIARVYEDYMGNPDHAVVELDRLYSRFASINEGSLAPYALFIEAEVQHRHNNLEDASRNFLKVKNIAGNALLYPSVKGQESTLTQKADEYTKEIEKERKK